MRYHLGMCFCGPLPKLLDRIVELLGPHVDVSAIRVRPEPHVVQCLDDLVLLWAGGLRDRHGMVRRRDPRLPLRYHPTKRSHVPSGTSFRAPPLFFKLRPSAHRDSFSTWNSLGDVPSHPMRHEKNMRARAQRLSDTLPRRNGYASCARLSWWHRRSKRSGVTRRSPAVCAESGQHRPVVLVRLDLIRPMVLKHSRLDVEGGNRVG